MKQAPSFYGLPEQTARPSTIAHPDTISHVMPVDDRGRFVSASIDGYLHLFSILDDQFDSLKIFKLHSAPFTDLAVSKRYMVSLSLDKTAKCFITESMEVVRVFKFDDIPETVCIIDDPTVSAEVVFLVTFRDIPGISIYSLKSDSMEHAVDTDNMVIVKMCYSSVNQRLMVFAEPNLMSLRVESVVKDHKCIPLKTMMVSEQIGALCMSNDEQMVAFTSSDHFIRVVSTATLKMIKRFDESLSFYERLVEAGKLDRSMVDSKWRVEQELQKSPYFAHQRVAFDHDDLALLYPSMLGVKTVDLTSNKAITIYGKTGLMEQRPVAVIVQRMHGDKVMSVDLAASDNPKALFESSSVLLYTVFRHNRLLVYNDYMGDSVHATADAFPVNQNDQEEPSNANTEQYIPGHKAIMRTTLGDIVIELYPQQTPLTVQNFCTQSRRHYYDGLLFHRVIRGFMIQTGCPRGDGTGGESIWGGYFRNELSADLKHDRPFTVSMANSGGPRTNGSQFFITTIRAPWLDRKHTVFGRVVEGEEVVRQIEQVETDRLDRPKQDVKVLTIEIE